MEIAELLIRESVRKTFTDYSTAADGGRLEDCIKLFSENATFEVPPGHKATGRSAIRDMVVAMSGRPLPATPPGQLSVLRHFTTNIEFRSLTESRVETTAYFCAMTAVGPDHWGRYFDVLVPEDGGWRFLHRIAKVEGYQAGGWNEMGRAVPGPS